MIASATSSASLRRTLTAPVASIVTHSGFAPMSTQWAGDTCFGIWQPEQFGMPFVAQKGNPSAAINVGGLLVAMPHKQAVPSLVQTPGEHTRLVGAANAVRFVHKQSVVEVFDALGLIQGARDRDIVIPGSSVLLAGARAPRAIAFPSQAPVAELTIANRTASAAEVLADQVRTEFPAPDVRSEAAQAGRHDVVINASSLGMRADDPSPVTIGSLPAPSAVIDIVTVPAMRLLTEAARQGCRTMKGGDMRRAMVDRVIDFWAKRL